MSKSIVIIDTPTSCWACPCLDGEYGKCQLTYKEVPTIDCILDCCPLKPYTDAIPIEWIAKQRIDTDEQGAFTTAYLMLIEKWREENEID